MSAWISRSSVPSSSICTAADNACLRSACDLSSRNASSSCLFFLEKKASSKARRRSSSGDAIIVGCPIILACEFLGSRRTSQPQVRHRARASLASAALCWQFIASVRTCTSRQLPGYNRELQQSGYSADHTAGTAHADTPCLTGQFERAWPVRDRKPPPRYGDSQTNAILITPTAVRRATQTSARPR